jgi:RNase P subunit RPR2
MIDLINGKTMYCPECGKPFDQYDGEVNGQSAHVSVYCKDCNKHYHWVAYISTSTGDHKVALFRNYLKVD